MEDLIRKFLSVSCGYGDGSGDGYGYGYGDGSGDGDGDGSGDGSGDDCGYGYGYGYGDGSGDGSGDGDGDGSGDGSGDGDDDGSGDGSGDGDDCGYGYGYGDGYGYGYGDGVKSINGLNVYLIDSLQTIIYSVHRNYAKGAVLQSDLTFKPCFIAKVGNFFAHGDTLKEAFNDANSKYLQNLPEEERISMFEQEFKLGVMYPTKSFYDWHNKLTGSCSFGRDLFAEQHNIDIDGKMTVEQFIELTKDSFGGEIIKKLYKNEKARN